MADTDRIREIAREIVHETLAAVPRLDQEAAARIAEAAAFKAVNEAHVRLFAQLGYDLANVKDIRRLRDTLTFTEWLRRSSASVADAITKAIAVAVVLGILAWIAIGARSSLMSGAPPTHIK